MSRKGSMNLGCDFCRIRRTRPTSEGDSVSVQGTWVVFGQDGRYPTPVVVHGLVPIPKKYEHKCMRNTYSSSILSQIYDGYCRFVNEFSNIVSPNF